MGKKNKTGVGQSILKARSRVAKGPRHGESWRHTSDLNDAEDWKRLNISSITEQNDLDDFLATAELAGTEFTAEKLNITVVTPSQNDGLLSPEKAKHVKQAQEDNKQLLRIPRRPPWTTSMDVQDLDLRERESLLEWRRQLALLQEKEHIILTPFEKNLEFWRQLWRVIERSDVIVQIVDARNPLLFRCEDLEVYVKEKSPRHKTNLLLINKADFLTPSQRAIWASYFKEKGICVAFWSALEETERLLKEKEKDADFEGLKQESKVTQNKVDNEDENYDSDDDDDDDDDAAITSRFSGLSTEYSDNKEDKDRKENVSLKDAKDENIEQKCLPASCETSKMKDNKVENVALDKHTDDEETFNTCENQLDNDRTEEVNESIVGLHDGCVEEQETCSGIEVNSSSCDESKKKEFSMDFSGKILTSEEFIKLCQQLHYHTIEDKPDESPKMTTIGMVGYPNVGKSSTINAILQHKKVSVSATPGKTKHYQTLNLSPRVCLCDCPGLVFPSFVSTKAEMVVNGILPIDQMRDHVPPVTLVCQRIPREVLEAVYGVNIAAPEEGEDPDRAPYADELLNAYGYMRGYMTSSGTPDCPRSARYILKDYVKGKLLYCAPPPGVDGVQFQEGRFSTGKYADLAETLEKKRTEMTLKAGARPKVSSIDQEFFAKKEVRHFVKGTPVMVPGQMGVAQLTSEGMIYKPWKKHHNRNKREKLRRLEKK